MSSADKWKVDFKLGPMRVSKLFRWVKAWFLTLGWSVHLVDVGLLEHHGSGIDKGDLPMKENLLKWPSFDWWIGWFRCSPFSSDPIERAFSCYFQKGRPTAPLSWHYWRRFHSNWRSPGELVSFGLQPDVAYSVRNNWHITCALESWVLSALRMQSDTHVTKTPCLRHWSHSPISTHNLYP